jgi:xylulose-5-phosphate/fructose-6-phosphate phosphoketolase
MEVIDRVPSLGSHAAIGRRQTSDARPTACAHTREDGEVDTAVSEWACPASTGDRL